MYWTANESHDKWVWRNTTDQSTPFDVWKKQRDEKRKASEAAAQQRRATKAAEKEQAAWECMLKSFATAAKKFGTAAKLP